jgi:hypothetical protein
MCEPEEDDLFVALNGDGTICGVEGVDARFRSFENIFQVSQLAELKREVVKDCEVVDLPLFNDTHWLPASMEPRTTVEKLASQIFKFHTTGVEFDAARSGAEWWVQNKAAEDAIDFHWDKDEDLRIETEMYVCPQVRNGHKRGPLSTGLKGRMVRET